MKDFEIVGILAMPVPVASTKAASSGQKAWRRTLVTSSSLSPFHLTVPSSSDNTSLLGTPVPKEVPHKTSLKRWGSPLLP